MYTLLLLRDTSIMDLAVNRFKVKGIFKLSANGHELILDLSDFIRFVVLDDMNLDKENPAILCVNRCHSIPCRKSSQRSRLLIAPVLQRRVVRDTPDKIVSGEAKLYIIPKEPVVFFHSLCLKSVWQEAEKSVPATKPWCVHDGG